MRNQVIARPRQQLLERDVNNIQTYVRSSMDEGFRAAIGATRRYIGLHSEAIGPAEIRVNSGQLAMQGEFYGLDTAQTFDMISNLPVAAQRKAAIVAWGTETETDIERRNFRTDVSTNQVEPQDVAVRRGRVANVDIIYGLESANPMLPPFDVGYVHVASSEPYIAGLGCKIIRDGDPNAKKPAGFWVSWSNAVIGGIVGTERPITFDYTDPDTESHFLNENAINTIVRDGGLRYWGGLTASSDRDWMFANVVRTRFAMEEMVAKDFAPIIDAPMTAPAVVEALVSLDEKLKDFETAGAIIRGRAFFLPAENSGGSLRRGQLRIEFDAEETPPIHGLTIGSRRNKKYFDILVEDIVRELAGQA